MRKKSITLIVIGTILFLVGAAGVLFPFVPVLFSDVQALSDHAVYGGSQGADDAVLYPAMDGEEATGSATTTTSTASVSPSTIAASDNRLFIDKIGVSVPVVEGKDAGALLYGAWRYPGTSSPRRGSNTVVFGHRFRYLPPNNTTFYNLDKLAKGDAFSMRWQGKMYRYKVTEARVIAPTDFSVVQPTDASVVTLITCTPLFSTKNRLVIRGELVPSGAQ